MLLTEPDVLVSANRSRRGKCILRIYVSVNYNGQTLLLRLLW